MTHETFELIGGPLDGATVRPEETPTNMDDMAIAFPIAEVLHHVAGITVDPETVPNSQLAVYAYIAPGKMRYLNIEA